MAWAVNYYNIYQSNDFNGIFFTVRGRALNTFISGAVQIPSAWILNIFTDKLPFGRGKKYGRRKRAFWALVYVFVSVNAVWIAGYFKVRETRLGLTEEERVDVFDTGYAGAAAVYVMYGFTDATYNCFAYWFIGALSNRPNEVSSGGAKRRKDLLTIIVECFCEYVSPPQCALSDLRFCA